MHISSGGSNVEVRALDVSGFVPQTYFPTLDPSSHVRGLEVPAIASAVRLIAETIAANFILRVYTGDGPNKQPVYDAPQAMLFQYPSESVTSVDLWEDIVTSIELYGNAFVWKTKTPKGVEALTPLDPEYICVQGNAANNSIRILGRVNGNQTDISSNVIHIKGWSPVAGYREGISTLDLHRKTAKSANAYELYRGRYFDNDATPGIVLQARGNQTLEQQRTILAQWMARHQGPKNANRPALLPFDMSVTQLASQSMRDSQGAEIADALVRDVARMFRIQPIELLHAQINKGVADVEAVSDAFTRFTLSPRFRRIERALSSDRDLFPDRKLYARFDGSQFIRGSVTAQADRAHKLKQVGIMTANEARAENELPPHPEGDQLLITPVGGFPNSKDPSSQGA